MFKTQFLCNTRHVTYILWDESCRDIDKWFSLPFDVYNEPIYRLLWSDKPVLINDGPNLIYSKFWVPPTF